MAGTEDKAARDRTYMAGLVAGMDGWMPVVARMRPDHAWDDVIRTLNARGPAEQRDWTAERLRRAVHRLVREGLADRRLIAPMPRPRT